MPTACPLPEALTIFLQPVHGVLVSGLMILAGIANSSLLGLMGSEICIAGYTRLLISRDTVLLDTGRHS